MRRDVRTWWCRAWHVNRKFSFSLLFIFCLLTTCIDIAFFYVCRLTGLCLLCLYWDGRFVNESKLICIFHETQLFMALYKHWPSSHLVLVAMKTASGDYTRDRSRVEPKRPHNWHKPTGHFDISRPIRRQNFKVKKANWCRRLEFRM